MTDTLLERHRTLPAAFCWTKFGTEAGEPIGQIRDRKEQERRQGDGTFLWGIGNSIAPSVKVLLRSDPRPSVLFTPMLSPAAKADVEPTKVFEWKAGQGLDGRPYQVPAQCRVTSRGTERTGRFPTHYALVCSSESPIDCDEEEIAFGRGEVLNLASGAPVGSSQVTSVVRLAAAEPSGEGPYSVAFRATLVYPYVVRLLELAGPSCEPGAGGHHEPLPLW